MKKYSTEKIYASVCLIHLCYIYICDHCIASIKYMLTQYMLSPLTQILKRHLDFNYFVSLLYSWWVNVSIYCKPGTSGEHTSMRLIFRVKLVDPYT